MVAITILHHLNIFTADWAQFFAFFLLHSQKLIIRHLTEVGSTENEMD
jgi:hypothetical protein